MHVSGSKNIALHLLAAAATLDDVTIENVPELPDVEHSRSILAAIGVTAALRNTTLETVRADRRERVEIPVSAGGSIRPTTCFALAALANAREVTFPVPGGDAFCRRPIDVHLRIAEAGGAEITSVGRRIRLRRRALRPFAVSCLTEWGPSLGGTVSGLLLASRAPGASSIMDASIEPEVIETGSLLGRAGVAIAGLGTRSISVVGMGRTTAATATNPADRMIAGTVIAFAAISRGTAILTNVSLAELPPGLKTTVRAMGITLDSTSRGLEVCASQPNRVVNIETGPHPGFPTDLQPQFTAVAATLAGETDVTETVYPERWTHVEFLNRAGASIRVVGNCAHVAGSSTFHPSRFVPTDIRCAAALVCAAVAAQGESTIETRHLSRGYARPDELLIALGVDATVVR